MHEFFAIVTHPRIYAPPTPIDIALDQIDAWLEAPSLVLLGESELHWPELRALITQGHIAGPRVHDARIAALCLQHGIKKLWTADRDFSRFPRLACVNPLIDESANA
ncbi:MAG: PIN domain-containing protein [Rhodocyclaceae bacterium]